ncbi:hypothetical protein KY358_05100, partial [Candidatus Woesearchaeota archaeon]|nr:hypothetical protein [Candidatus Woesearchaeota archaeon]
GKDGNTKNINKKGVNEEIETKEGDITTKTTYNTETKSKTIEKKDEKTDTTTTQVSAKSKEGHTLTYEYTGKEAPKEAVFQMADKGRKTTIHTESVRKAIGKGDIGIEHLSLASQILKGQETPLGTFLLGKDDTDAGWDYKNGELTLGKSITLNVKDNKAIKKSGGGTGPEGQALTIKYTAYELIEGGGGYTYYEGSDIQLREISNPIPIEPKTKFIIYPGEDYSKTEQFTAKTKKYGTTFEPGQYVSEEFKKGSSVDGKLIYGPNPETGNLEVQGAVLENKNGEEQAYKMEELYSENGELKSLDEWQNMGISVSNKNRLQVEKTKKFLEERSKSWYGWSTFGSFWKLNNALNALTESAAAGEAFSSLLVKGENIDKWRKTMDNFFSNNILGSFIGGNWEESICHLTSMPKDTENVFNFNLPGGIVGTGIYVSAERVTISAENIERPHLYKISYGISQPTFRGVGEDEIVHFNLQLRGQRTINIFTSNKEIAKSQTISARIGQDAAYSVPVKYSKYIYNQVCLIFTKDVQKASGHFRNEFCFPITSKQQTATTYGGEETIQDEGTVGDGTVNDF